MSKRPELERGWSQVIHLPDEVQEQAMAFCKANHLHAMHWVSRLILEAAKGEQQCLKPRK